MTDSAQQLETLKSIFPDIEPEVCQLVLENNQHQLEQAIEQLLNFSDPSQQTQPVSNCPDTSNDEELARQLAASEQAHEEDLNSNLNEPPLINVVSESAGEPTSETHSVLTKLKSSWVKRKESIATKLAAVHENDSDPSPLVEKLSLMFRRFSTELDKSAAEETQEDDCEEGSFVNSSDPSNRPSRSPSIQTTSSIISRGQFRVGRTLSLSQQPVSGLKVQVQNIKQKHGDDNDFVDTPLSAASNSAV